MATAAPCLGAGLDEGQIEPMALMSSSANGQIKGLRVGVPSSKVRRTYKIYLIFRFLQKKLDLCHYLKTMTHEHLRKKFTFLNQTITIFLPL